ncbi:MAG: four helix bundle protein [Gemmatimonadales bacterium]
MASHRGLKAWEHARTLAVECTKAARGFPLEEQRALADQLRRAATGAALNIAEGASRTSNRDYRRFLDTARSSLMEVSAVLEIARDVGYVESSTYARLEARCDEASKTLYGLLRSVDRRLESGAARRP